MQDVMTLPNTILSCPYEINTLMQDPFLGIKYRVLLQRSARSGFYDLALYHFLMFLRNQYLGGTPILNNQRQGASSTLRTL